MTKNSANKNPMLFLQLTQKSIKLTWHFLTDKVFPMGFDVDSPYPLYHHRYQVKIPVDDVRCNLILMEIFVDEIFREGEENNLNKEYLNLLLPSCSTSNSISSARWVESHLKWSNHHQWIQKRNNPLTVRRNLRP